MRIGILTFHRSINNGAVMQCYSLCKKLQENFSGCEIEVIDYYMPNARYILYPSTLREYYSVNDTFIRKYVKGSLRLFKYPNRIRRQREQQRIFESVLKYLPLSDKYIFDNDTNELYEYINEKYDIVVAGSDAIWNYNVRGFPNPYFLDSCVKSKKFAYAASCYGMQYELLADNQCKVIKKILDEYEFIGVRDDESEKFTKFLNCNKEVHHTCDPTFFLDVNQLPINIEVLTEKLRKNKFEVNKPAIGVMANERICRLVKKLFGKEYQIVSLHNYSRYADVNLYTLNPYEWAYVFRFFKLTFTTYFHGTLLSLRNGVPVICMALQNEFNRKHLSKVEDVLIRLGMQDCYFEENYSFENIQRILKKANYFLENNMYKEIVKRVDREAETSKIFFDEMRKIIRD